MGMVTLRPLAVLVTVKRRVYCAPAGAVGETWISPLIHPEPRNGVIETGFWLAKTELQLGGVTTDARKSEVPHAKLSLFSITMNSYWITPPDSHRKRTIQGKWSRFTRQYCTRFS